MVDIGLKIKTLIEEKNISITEFAKLMDVERSTIYNYFNKKSIDLVLLIEISNKLEVPINYFLDEEVKITANDFSYEKRIEDYQKQIHRYESQITTLQEEIESYSHDVNREDIDELIKEIITNALEGRGLVFLYYDEEGACFEKEYQKLQEKLPFELLGKYHKKYLL
jgi:transcriptional regulator with XRE-family HTH domain